MQNRRSFIKKLAIGSAVISLITFPKKMKAMNDPIENMLIHHVYFWLNDPENTDVCKQFEKGISKLIKVETIHQSHFGRPASTEKREVVDHSYTYSLMLMFQSQNDQDVYQVHPIHKKFVEENSMLWDKVIVYDSTNIAR
ncbi:MAG: Dabb family protein [Prolixibacteraceae bacterium]